MLKNPDDLSPSQARKQRDKLARDIWKAASAFASNPRKFASVEETLRQNVDELFGCIETVDPDPAPKKRQAKGGRNRMETGGEDRSDDTQEELPTDE